MQPLGRSYCKIPGIAKKDVHPPTGYVNWWEDIVTPKKKAARQADKNQIKKEINGYFKDS